MLKRYNALQEKDVQLQTCDVPGKGTRIYMSMPSLGIALSKLDTLPESDRVMILHHALEKVAEMHEDQTVHFDITLNNLLYDPKSGKVAICDFGCAEKFGHEPKTINRESEPPAYNAAYDKKEHFSAAYDVFSLGKAMANFLGFTPNNNKAAPSSPSPDEENSDSGYKDESTLAQEQASLAAKAEAPVMTESSYDRLAAQTENLQKHLAPHPNSYNGPDDLFDFENSSIKNKVIIDLLKAMMAPNPADRPSAADCVKKLETALSLAGQNISASPKRN